MCCPWTACPCRVSKTGYCTWLYAARMCVASYKVVRRACALALPRAGRQPANEGMRRVSSLLVWAAPSLRPAAETRKERRYPKGSRELPYVIYLLTFYPAVMVLTWAACILLMPYCLAYFALYGYRNWLEELRSADPEAEEAAESPDRPLGGAAPPQMLKVGALAITARCCSTWRHQEAT